jgi:hypothetical protein
MSSDPNVRVLYIAHDYPQATEVYVEDELHHALAQGAQAAAWVATQAPLPEQLPPGVELQVGGPISKLIGRFQPNVVHMHWMQWGKDILDHLHSFGLPITVRAHTDTTLERLQLYCAHPAVKRLYLYPGQQEHYSFFHDKVAIAPIGVGRPEANVPRQRNLVLRGASTNQRAQTFMIDVAERMPHFNFRLALGDCHHVSAPANVAEIRRRVTDPLENLRIDWNVCKAGMAKLFNRAGIYLFTFPEGRAAKMPLSIAQALAAGCYVLAPNQPPLARMLGKAGALYDSIEHACELIDDTKTWTDQRWDATSAAAKAQAEPMLPQHAYADLVPYWRSLRKTG